MINIHVASPWFEYIKAGQKTVEGRLCKNKFSTIQPGMSICMVWQGPQHDAISVHVKRVTPYPSFACLLEKEGLPNVLPGHANMQDGVQAYRKFYTREDEEKYGVVAIEFGVFQHETMIS